MLSDTSVSSFLPTIWIGDFQSKKEFDDRLPTISPCFEILANMDDAMLRSRHPFAFRAWCASCCEVTSMQISWHYGGIGSDGTVSPAWTETCSCSQCGLNSRMRALVDCLSNRFKTPPTSRVYVAEQVTPAYRALKRFFGDVTGSEYLGPGHRSGEKAFCIEARSRVRHEDLSRLSFPDAAFDIVVTQDVLEHIPDYRKAVSEIARVLRSPGKLVFTVPFFADLSSTRIRAREKDQGEIEHILPPEIHGDPVSSGGALCFQNFGWDLLGDLRTVGFARSTAHMYWGPWAGHLGFPFFVFSADK